MKVFKCVLDQETLYYLETENGLKDCNVLGQIGKELNIPSGMIPEEVSKKEKEEVFLLKILAPSSRPSHRKAVELYEKNN